MRKILPSQIHELIEPVLCNLHAGAGQAILAFMIKISTFIPAAPAAAARRKRTGSVGASGFSSLLSDVSESDAVGDSAAANALAATSALPGLLGLQEISDEEMARKQAVKHGFSTLDTLEDLRDALLMGSVPAGMLRQIERMVAQQRQQVADPRLLSILDDIELRAAVELAKLEMAGRRRP